MFWLEPVSLYWCLAAVHVLGLLTACLTRLGEGSLAQAWFQRLFVGCLLLAGAATFTSLALGPHTCMVSGATLVVTILTATWDVGAAVL